MTHVLIYIDIMGFEEKAKKDAESTGRPIEDIRNSYITSTETRLYTQKNTSVILNFNKMSLDSWLISTDSFWNAFRCIDEILKTKLDFEIAIGIIGRSHTINELENFSDSMMSFLKENTIYEYKKAYKYTHSSSPMKTFILVTKEAYKKLEYKICYKPYTDIDIYSIELDQLENALKKYNFMNCIGSNRSEYMEIDELFVPPKSFSNILNILNEHNLVFLVGDPEIGKTYTSIKLLSDFNNENYKPCYYPEERMLDQWKFIRETPEIEGKAIYLEDPWGKIEFKTAESLFTEIGSFIREIKRTNCKVIISSREDIFRKFKSKMEIAEDISKYVVELRLGSEYDRYNLKNILNKYANTFRPAWYSDINLRYFVYENISDKLRTPMSIKKLVDITIDSVDKQYLIEGIELASKETKIVFAKEIGELFEQSYYDRLLFLSLAYIELDLEVARTCYQDVLIQLKNDGYNSDRANSFEELFEEYGNKKIEVNFGSLMYIHPSYKEAFKISLISNNRPSNISRTIFSKILLRIAEDSIDALLARILFSNYDEIDENTRNRLLSTITDEDSPAWSSELGHYNHNLTCIMSDSIINNFSKIPTDIRHRILCNISKIDDRTFDGFGRIYAQNTISWVVAENFKSHEKEIIDILYNLSEVGGPVSYAVSVAIDSNFSKLDPYNRLELLRKLANINDTAGVVAHCATENFEDIPNDVFNELLFNLAKNNRAAKILIEFIMTNYGKLSENIQDILFTLSDRRILSADILLSLGKNFSTFPENSRNELLLKLVDESEPETSDYEYRDRAIHQRRSFDPNLIISKILREHFDEIPTHVRNSLIIKLYQKREWSVAAIIIENFDLIPGKLCNLLFLMSKNESAAKIISKSIAENYNDLPISVMCLLQDLSRSDKIAAVVALDIIKNADKLPHEVLRILINVSENEAVAKEIAYSIDENFNNLPEDIRNDLLLKFIEMDEISIPTARIIAQNYDAIPRDIRNHINRLLEDQNVLEYFGMCMRNFDGVRPVRIQSEYLLNKIIFKLSYIGWCDLKSVIANFALDNLNKLPTSEKNDLMNNIEQLCLKIANSDESYKHLVDGQFDFTLKDIKSILHKLNHILEYLLINCSEYDPYELSLILAQKKDISKFILIDLINRNRLDSRIYAESLMDKLLQNFKNYI